MAKKQDFFEYLKQISKNLLIYFSDSSDILELIEIENQVLIITNSEIILILSQRINPCKKGFIPTVLIETIERPEPIKNKHKVSPLLASHTDIE